MPILDVIRAQAPDLLVMAGDNVYADADTIEEIEQAYAALEANPRWKALEDAIPMVAIWDDHDYGRNDVGSEYPFKEGSKKLMLDFFDVPADHPRRSRNGNYAQYSLKVGGRRVQIILLDMRWFRDPLRQSEVPGRQYDAHDDPAATLLGAEQWTWLASVLERDADLRILVSSIQVLAGDHGYESWSLFPHERQRLIDLIAAKEVDGLVIVSGDRHRGELSCALAPGISYPLLELTTSSLNVPIPKDEPNRFRVPGTALYQHPNFGVISVGWSEDPPTVEAELRDVRGDPVAAFRTVLSVLDFDGDPIRNSPCKRI